jgi:hypothetical protein
MISSIYLQIYQQTLTSLHLLLEVILFKSVVNGFSLRLWAPWLTTEENS